jgi:cytochrome d ubiquinol oxidase subunit II
MSALAIFWFIIIFVVIFGYFVLDGFDLGVGVAYPFLAKNEKEKAILRYEIGPVWDGNEVWLLTAGGALFAAFGPAYATTFSGFYLAIMLVLFGLIVRAVAVEFASRDEGWAKLWNALFFIGSLLPALLFGVAVGNIYAGIPMSASGDYIGVPLLGLVTPFTLLCGLLGLCMMMAAGASWLAVKASAPELRDRASGLRRPLQIACLVLFVLISLLGHFVIQPEMTASLGAVRWLCAIVFVVGLVAALALDGKDGRELPVFLLQSLASVALVFLLATSMFPNLVVASAGSVGPTITIANAASSDTALAAMTVIACIGVPLVLIYHVIAYRTFRGRVRESDLEY